MCEIPSNVILAKEFAERFDGFSIGSNDLTQLTLGVDRDSAELAGLFDEQDEAVKWMIGSVIARSAQGRRQGRPVRPGAERPSGVRRIPGRLRHRLDLGQPRQLRRREEARRGGRGDKGVTARIRSAARSMSVAGGTPAAIPQGPGSARPIENSGDALPNPRYDCGAPETPQASSGARGRPRLGLTAVRGRRGESSKFRCHPRSPMSYPGSRDESPHVTRMTPAASPG